MPFMYRWLLTIFISVLALALLITYVEPYLNSTGWMLKPMFEMKLAGVILFIRMLTYLSGFLVLLMDCSGRRTSAPYPVRYEKGKNGERIRIPDTRVGQTDPFVDDPEIIEW